MLFIGDGHRERDAVIEVFKVVFAPVSLHLINGIAMHRATGRNWGRGLRAYFFAHDRSSTRCIEIGGNWGGSGAGSGDGSIESLIIILLHAKGL